MKFVFLLLLLVPSYINADIDFYLGLKNWGLTNDSGNHSDISAVKAWTVEQGNRDIVVAVIDTGIDSNHIDLAKNLWHDPNSPSIYGWNFVNDQSNPTDSNGHGTHVSGIIGAVLDTQTGISGVVHKISIMSLKYYLDSNSGSVNLQNTVKAINYAVEHGARIINYSGGGPEFSEDEYLAIKSAEAHNVLVVAAAGNERSNTDLTENFYYPASYHLPNVISVMAIDIRNNKLLSSNWGKNKVDVAAPGENILSTLPGGRYGYMSGTSQATAFVSGLAAMLLSKNPNLTPTQIRHIIMESVDKLPQIKEMNTSGGRINAYAALKLLKKELTSKVRNETLSNQEN